VTDGRPQSARIRAQVARFLGVARGAEDQLLKAFILVAERHERQYELQHGATVLAGWSREDLVSLKALEERYGTVPSDSAQRLRSVLLGGTRATSVGTIEDLQDLTLLTENAAMAWLTLFQGAKELHDKEMLAISSAAQDHKKRQLAWLRTQIKHDAPEMLAVAADLPDEVAASRPKRPTAVSSIPDPAWSPSAATVLLAIVGAAGLLVGRPWLLPSLGPTAVLQAENPAHPTSRAWNVVVGHMGGLIAGFIGVLVFHADATPPVLVAKVLAPERVGAALLAIFLAVFVGQLTRSSHPPAAATTLLVALGSISTLLDAANLMAGVVILTIAGEAIRYVRLSRIAPAERMSPRSSLARLSLRRR
jgi:HPP family